MGPADLDVSTAPVPSGCEVSSINAILVIEHQGRQVLQVYAAIIQGDLRGIRI